MMGARRNRVWDIGTTGMLQGLDSPAARLPTSEHTMVMTAVALDQLSSIGI
jgi:hypothetical protein